MAKLSKSKLHGDVSYVELDRVEAAHIIVLLTYMLAGTYPNNFTSGQCPSIDLVDDDDCKLSRGRMVFAIKGK